MSTIVKHSGIIVSTEGTTARVRIKQSSACGSCQVSRHCSVAEAKEKIIEAHHSHAKLTPGDEVIVSTSAHTAWCAVAIGFVVPLILLLVILVCAKWQGFSDEASALLALGILIPYYFIIWLFRNSFSRKMLFLIEEPM